MSTDNPVSLHSLLEIPEDDLVPPHVDPCTAALVALGVVDFIHHDGKARFAELVKVGGIEPKSFVELERLADTLLRVISVFESAPRAPRPVTIPRDLDTDARAKRSALQHALRAYEDPEVVRILQRQKLSYGPIDLAIDLRAAAALLVRHSNEPEQRALAEEGRALAARLETHLWTHDTRQLREARVALHRVWFAFEPAYHTIAALGRELFADAEAVFPTLEAIADIERQARQVSSSKHPAAELVEHELPPSRRSVPPSRRSASRIHAVSPSQAPRALVEVELHESSDSNVWLGFSQDIAEGGVFVASYVSQPLGTELDLDLHLHDHDPPVRVAGQVCWVRPPSAGDDLPAGYGVRLTSASQEATRALTRLANARTPIFYDE